MVDPAIVLDEWMHVTGYSQKMLDSFSIEDLTALYGEAHERGAEFHVTNGEGEDNPYNEFMYVLEYECRRREHGLA